MRVVSFLAVVGLVCAPVGHAQDAATDRAVTSDRAVAADRAVADPAVASDPAAASDRAVRIDTTPPRLLTPAPVAARATPSGLAVPRWVSLKTGRTNCRIGPTRGHRVAYQYQRRGLPVMVEAETEQWRRVRDVNGDVCWIKATGLSGARRVVVMEAADILTKPRSMADGGRLRARAGVGVVLDLEGCRAAWCEVRTSADGKAMRGWIRRDALWGTQAL